MALNFNVSPLSPQGMDLEFLAKQKLSSTSTIPTTKLISKELIDAEWFINQLDEDKITDKDGWILETFKLPEMPELLLQSKERLDLLLQKMISLSVFGSKKDNTTKHFLKGLSRDKGRTYLQGGAVLWVLGSQGIYHCGTKLHKKFSEKYSLSSLSYYDEKKGDTDWLHVTHSQAEDPCLIAQGLLEYLAEGFKSRKHTQERICYELKRREGSFAKFDPFYKIKKQNFEKNGFLISYLGSDNDLDLMIASIIDLSSLLTQQDLRLDITDYLYDTSVPLRVTGKSFKGWQAIVAILGKIIQFQSLNHQAWGRAQTKKILGFRTLSPYPPQVYAKMKISVLSDLLSRLSKQHISKNPPAALMLLLDSASDLLAHGFHPLEIDQLCHSLNLDIAHYPLLATFYKSIHAFPIDALLAMIRLGQSRKNKEVTYNNKNALIWCPYEHLCIIQLEVPKALECLIKFEMIFKTASNPEKTSLLNELFQTLHIKVQVSLDINSSMPFSFEITKMYFPQHLTFVCELLFINFESNDVIALTLINEVIKENASLALKMFYSHLRAVKTVNSLHITIYKKFIDNYVSKFNPGHFYEAINHICGLGILLGKKSPELIQEVNKVVENVIRHLLENEHYSHVFYLIKLYTPQKGFSITQTESWMQCCIGLYKQSKSIKEAVKFWKIGNKKGIWDKPSPLKLHKFFLIEFVKSLYNETSSESIQIANRLLDWLPIDSHEEYSSETKALFEKRKQTMIELQTIHEKDIQLRFEKISKGSLDLGEKKTALSIYKKLIVYFNEPKIDLEAWRINVNKVWQTLTNNTVTEFFETQSEEWQTFILNYVESAFNSDFHSQVILDILEKEIKVKQPPKLAKKLIVRGIQEERFAHIQDHFKATLKDILDDLILGLFKDSQYSLILSVCHFMVRSNIECKYTQDFYHSVYLKSFIVLLKQETSEIILEDSLLFCVNHFHSHYVMIADTQHPDQRKDISELIEGLLNYRCYSLAVKWIETLLNCLENQNQGTSPEMGLQVLSWVKTISKHEPMQNLKPFVLFLYKKAKHIQDQLCKLIIDLPDEFLTVDPITSGDIFFHSLEKNKECVDRSLISKIQRLIPILLSPPNSLKTFSLALKFYENNIDHTWESLADLNRALNGTNHNELQLRCCKLYRIRFIEYLYSNDFNNCSRSIFLTSMKSHYKAIQLLIKKKTPHTDTEIAEWFNFYLDKKVPLENWIEDPAKLNDVVGDIFHVFNSLFALMKNISDEKIKMILSLRIRVVEHLKNNPIANNLMSFQENFISVDEAIIDRLFDSKDPDLYHEGIKLLYVLVSVVPQSSQKQIDLYVKMIRNSNFLTGSHLQYWDSACPQIQNLIYSKPISGVNQKKILDALMSTSHLQENNIIPEKKAEYLKMRETYRNGQFVDFPGTAQIVKKASILKISCTNMIGLVTLGAVLVYFLTEAYIRIYGAEKKR